MCGPAALPIISLGTTLLGGVLQARAQQQAGQAQQASANFQAQVARNNQIVAERQAQDAILRGAGLETEKRFETQRLIGQQRAALAANGVVVSQGSALDITAGTAGLGELDALTIRNNAQREAFGFRARGAGFAADATLLQTQGEQANRAARSASFGTLLGTGTRFAGQFRTFRKEGAFG